MSERRIYKYQGTLIGDNRVDDLIAQEGNKVSHEEFEELVKVTPTDINLDSQNNLILEHDGKEISNQKKLVNLPIKYLDFNINSYTPDTIYTFDSAEGLELKSYIDLTTASKGSCILVVNIHDQALYVFQSETEDSEGLYIYNQGVSESYYVSKETTGYKIVKQEETITTSNINQMTKTLFGDQHIYGTGNIDLFCHMITITDTDGNVDCIFDFYSSKNLKCDSLADLKTLLGNTFTRKCNGIVKDGDTTKVVYKITETSLVFTDGTTKVLLGVTFNDVVKTI